MLLQSDYPPDIRLTKEIRALVGADHQLFLLCNNSRKMPALEVVDGAQVIRLPSFSYLPAGWSKFLRLPLFLSPLWLWYALKCIIRHNIDILHVHDLPLAPLVVLVGRLLHMPVIYDMHENYPAAMANWASQQKGIQRLIKSPVVANLLNRLVLKLAARIIVVVEEQRDNLIREGIPSNKISIVGNTVDVDEFLHLPIDKEIFDRYQSLYMILYLGSFSSDRGLETAIRAMKLIRNDVPNAHLLLVGNGKNMPDLQTLTKKESLENQVGFVGWVPFVKVASYMAASKICIIPQPSNAANDTTLPHKLFQYMLIEKPVLTSDAAPLKRIVTECRCGEVFHSDDEQDFARSVIKMHHSSVPYGQNGKRMVFEKYHWQETSKQLLKLYEQIH